MKALSPLLLIALCSGCATYQYATLTSQWKQDQNEFLMETDTLKIVYNFSGEQGPVRISVYNKLNTPIYVDWSKSALIIDNRAISFFNNNYKFSGIVEGRTTYRPRSIQTDTSYINGIIVGKELKTFVPPRSRTEQHHLNLNPEPFNLKAPGAVYHSKKVKGYDVKHYYYDQNNSPFKVKSFITWSLNEDMSNPSYLNHDFWISEIAETELGPANFPQQADIFYIKRSY